MSTSGVESGASAALGTVAAAVALVGSGLAVRGGGAGTLEWSLVAATGVAILVFLGRRHGAIERRLGAVVASVAGIAHFPLTMAIVAGGETPLLELPLLGGLPSVSLAAVGAIGIVAAAAADWFGLTGREIADRAAATGGYGAVGVCGYLAVIVWLVVLLSAYVTVSGTPAGGLGTVESVTLEQAATVLGIGTTAALFLGYKELDRSFIDLDIPSVTDVITIVLGIGAILGAAAGISMLLEALETETATHGTVEAASGNPEILLLLVPASILIVGPFEELLFRNIVQKSLYEHFSKPGAVVAASIPFALVHAPAYGSGSVSQVLTSLAIVLFLSLLLGGVYAYTDNLTVPALVHGCYNAALFLSLYVTLTG